MILQKRKKLMRLVKPVNYWGIVINTKSNYFDQICRIMEICVLCIDYISVAFPLFKCITKYCFCINKSRLYKVPVCPNIPLDTALYLSG